MIEEDLAISEHIAPRRSAAGALTIWPLQGRTGLILDGEADITSQAALRAALAGLPADGGDDIHLELAGLRFIDVCCTRELLAAAGRHPAVSLVVHHPPASLLRITALIDTQARVKIAPPGPVRPGCRRGHRPDHR